MNVGLVDDDYVRDSVRWVVELNNGQVVYQDDDRPGVLPRSAWLRLRRYCLGQGVRISRMWFQFRSHRVQIGPDGARGYFFCKMAMAVCGEATYHGYVGGHLREDGQIEYTRWLTPALIPIESGVRSIPDQQFECLIDFGRLVSYNDNGTTLSAPIAPGGHNAHEE